MDSVGRCKIAFRKMPGKCGKKTHVVLSHILAFAMIRRSLSILPRLSSTAPTLLNVPARMMGGGGHDDHTLEPPFHRLPLPNRPLPEEDELIWNDRVAPETALDFDAPHISSNTGLLMWLGGFAFFYGVFQFAKSTAHPGNKPTVSVPLWARTATFFGGVLDGLGW